MGDLASLAREAAVVMNERGMCRKNFESREGEVCMLGAIRVAARARGWMAPADWTTWRGDWTNWRGVDINRFVRLSISEFFEDDALSVGMIVLNDDIIADTAAAVEMLNLIGDALDEAGL